jgi:hypothetical protein
MVNNMSRTLKLGAERLIAGGSEVVVELSQGEAATFALELVLLLRGLTNLVNVMAGAAKLVLRLAEPTSTATTFNREASGRMVCSLTRDNAEYLEATLLRAYRDGMAEVNHVHVQGTLDGESFDLTLLFDSSRLPMTPEEAEKLMSR